MSSRHDEAILAKLVKQGKITREEKSAIKSSGAKKVDHEEMEQCELVEWFGMAYPMFSHLLIHIPNGGSRRSKFEGYRLKKAGTKKGVSDLFLPVARQGFHGMWIEFKATPPRDCVVSESQQQWIDYMLEQGYLALVCKGTEAAQKALTEYLR